MNYGRTKGRVESQISSRVRNFSARLNQLEREQVPKPPDPLRFRSPVTNAGTDAEEPLISLRAIDVPGRLSLARLDLRPTEHLLVSGPNGAGKSTLLAVLAGELTPTGLVRRRADLTVGFLTQDSVFPHPDRTARETYDLTLGPDLAESVPLATLGLLTPADLGQRVDHLSVGQRRRLALALLIAQPPELLLLDEPTNHLSPTLADELEDAFSTGPGTTVLTTHDRWLQSRWPHAHLRL
jgi:macrolide transport system ATP-binding/permease protein